MKKGQKQGAARITVSILREHHRDLVLRKIHRGTTLERQLDEVITDGLSRRKIPVLSHIAINTAGQADARD